MTKKAVNNHPITLFCTTALVIQKATISILKMGLNTQRGDVCGCKARSVPIDINRGVLRQSLLLHTSTTTLVKRLQESFKTNDEYDCKNNMTEPTWIICTLQVKANLSAIFNQFQGLGTSLTYLVLFCHKQFLLITRVSDIFVSLAMRNV